MQRRPSALPVKQSSSVARPLIAAAVCVVFVVAVVATLGRLGAGTGKSPSRTAAFIGDDLHSVVALADGRVYVGGHEGATVTRDGGATWTSVTALAGADAMGWASTDDGLFVSGHDGVRRSDDDGGTFHEFRGLPDSDAHAFGAGSGVLLAAGPNLGVVASRDGGRTWQQRSDADGRSFFGRIIVDPADPDRLIAADAQNGPARSGDGGLTWESLGEVPPAVWVSSPDGGTTIYSSSGGSYVWRSTDGGGGWEPLQLPDGAELVEAAAGGDGRKLYAAGRRGSAARLWISIDGGATWDEPAARRGPGS